MTYRERDEFLRAVIAELYDGNVRWPGLWTRLASLMDERDQLREALQAVGALQPKALSYIRANGFVFDQPLGAEPGNWYHLAFSLYCELCEADVFARAALAEQDEAA